MSISCKTAEMIVKQLIYDSCMIVEKGTIISIQYDIQCSHKKHDGMIVVFFKIHYSIDKFEPQMPIYPLLLS